MTLQIISVVVPATMSRQEQLAEAHLESPSVSEILVRWPAGTLWPYPHSALKILVDGRVTGTVEAAGSTRLGVQPGDRELKVESRRTGRYRSDPLLVHADADTTVMVVVGEAVGFMRYHLCLDFRTFFWWWTLIRRLRGRLPALPAVFRLQVVSVEPISTDGGP
jgi:hypothetical protein